MKRLLLFIGVLVAAILMNHCDNETVTTQTSIETTGGQSNVLHATGSVGITIK